MVIMKVLNNYEKCYCLLSVRLRLISFDAVRKSEKFTKHIFMILRSRRRNPYTDLQFQKNHNDGRIIVWKMAVFKRWRHSAHACSAASGMSDSVQQYGL